MELELKALTKTFESFTAVDHVSCTMSNGVYGLLGVNGSGKNNPDADALHADETNQRKHPVQRQRHFRHGRQVPRDVGISAPEIRLLSGFYGKGLSECRSRPLRGYGRRQQKRVKALLARTGLTKAADKKMKKLSGGMKRRAGIAQAMLNNPEILILDEPTAGLDPGERVRFRNLISEIAEDRLVLLSTHIVSDVEYIAKEILLMKEGKIAHAGTAEELIGAMPQRVAVQGGKESGAGADKKVSGCQYQVGPPGGAAADSVTGSAVSGRCADGSYAGGCIFVSF